MTGISRPTARAIARPLSSPLAGGGGGGLLDFLPPALRAGGMAMGTSRLFGSYLGPLARLRRDSDSVEMDAGSGAARITSDDVIGFCGKNLLARSNEFSLSPWLVENGTATITPNYGLAPDGTTPTTMISFALGAAYINQKVFIPAIKGTQAAASIGIRVIAGDAMLRVSRLGAGYPDATELTISSNEWQRASVPHRYIASFEGLRFDVRALTDGTTVEIYNAQLEYGSTTTEYEARGATGASPCYIPKLYDQLGSNDAVQTIGTQQPQIVPRQIGEMPVIVGDEADDMLRAASFMATLNGKDITVIQAGRNALCGNSAASRLYVGGAASSYDLSANLAHGNSGNRRVLSLQSEGAAQSARINGVEAATATQPQIATYGGTDFLLGQAGSAFGNPPQSNLVFPSALNLTTLAAIEAKLMTEYQITP